MPNLTLKRMDAAIRRANLRVTGLEIDFGVGKIDRAIFIAGMRAAANVVENDSCYILAESAIRAAIHRLKKEIKNAD